MSSTVRSESGVAMVTVLLVAAALTALTSAATFVTMQEFGATRADRNAAQALSFAEAGIDRLMLEIRGGNITWNNMGLAGCDAQHPLITRTGSIGAGTYETTLEVYDRQATATADRFRPAACAKASTSPVGTHSFLITSTGQTFTGQQPSARRIVRQVIDIKPLGLPIGAYAYDRIDANGTVNMHNASMVTEGVVTNRDNIGFKGTDPYYLLSHFYGPRITDPAIGAYRMPAAVHARGAITYGRATRLVEHRTGREPNCETSPGVNPKGTAGQSQWDGSGTAVLDSLTTFCTWAGSGEVDSSGVEGPIVTPNSVLPPTAQFTEEDRKRIAPLPRLSDQDYLTLKQSAKGNGLYCRVRSGTVSDLECSEAGGTFTALTANKITAAHIDDARISRTFVVYVEFNNDGLDPFGKKVVWSQTDVKPCSSDPAINRTVVIIVRNGSLDASGGSYVNGAMLLPEGQFESTGGFTLEGTIIVRRIANSGTVTLRLSTCWLQNMPGPFLDVIPVSWAEVDR